MHVNVFRFEFDREVPLSEAEMSLHLALFAAEGLFGCAWVRMDGAYWVDAPRHAIVLDGTTLVGNVIVRIFTGLLLREFGDEAFELHRVAPAAFSAPAPAPAPEETFSAEGRAA